MAIPYYDPIAHHAARYPQRCALIDLAVDKRLTYARLDERVSRLARRFKDAIGIRRGDRVAILADSSSNYLEVLFACGRIGAILLPLNCRLTMPELEVIVGDGEPRLLVHDDKYEAQAAALLAASNGIERCWDIGLSGIEHEHALQAGALLEVPEPLTLDDVQVIMYTSGTTGVPKGALLTYGMAFWNAINVGISSKITAATRALTVMPMFHTAGLNIYAAPTLHAGGTVLIMPAFDARRVLEVIDDPCHGVTHFFGVPSVWQFLAQHELFAATDFSRIVCAGVGGAAAPVPLLETWQARGVTLVHGYGMTETSPSVSNVPDDDAIRKAGSIGKPLLHNEMKVARADGSEADVDEPGEIWIRGPNVTPGYWRRPEATAAAFVDGWLRSGDIGRKDAEGFFFILDRAKDMYISGGENVYPAEVEAVILQIPDVVAVAVIGVPDARWGETGVAMIVARRDTVVTAQQVLDHIRDRLARFKHPRDVLFVDQLPLTASGKVHKPSLRTAVADMLERV